MNYKTFSELQTQLIKLNPSLVNQLGQVISFYQPQDLDLEIIVVCFELSLADNSRWCDLHDMTAPHGEYAPIFLQDGFLVCAYEVIPEAEMTNIKLITKD